MIRSLFAKFVPAALCLLAGCVPGQVKTGRLALPCPAPGSPAAVAGSPTLFVARTNRSECRDGAWVLSRERGEGPSFDLARRGESHWAFAFGDQDTWLTALKSQAQTSSHGAAPRVLVYIHGFNNTPDAALDRANRIAQDADFKGPVVALIWPSQQGVFKFASDETNNEWTRAYADDVLRKLAGAGLDIVLVSHSMGNRITADVLERLSERAPDLARRVRTVVLASPDLDAGTFERDVARTFAAPDRTVTIYASKRDTALATSSRLHGYRRVGDLGCKFARLDLPPTKEQFCYPRIEGARGVRVIDTSAVSNSPFGHSDFIASPAGSADLCRVINGLAEQGRRAIPGYAGVFALDASAASRADCPDAAPPSPPKPGKTRKAAR
jgi:pimeloyl-ACP methyl ester carboxylesterase